jgi:dienelactone hydrolase
MRTKWFDTPTEETNKLKAAFSARSQAFDKNTKDLLEFTSAAKSKWGGVESWGAFGLCWGGKVCSPSSFLRGR